tara:strand:- start:1226 stop:2185 length:960 start_codon:yes stop_codon:yes gene_type:complete
MYYELFKKLTSPNANNENEFKTSLIPKTSHRVAKNAKGLPSILINTKDDDSLINNYKGANIFLRFKENCKIHEDNSSGIFTILSCRSDDELTIKMFLDICETTIPQLNDEPTANEIKRITNIIIELFREISDKKRSIVGLWGELFLIYTSSDIKKTLQAWHENPSDKYDFYDDNEALEVKCTSQTDRIHKFKHDQLLSEIKNHLVVSIMVSESQNDGMSVLDLYESIKQTKPPIDLINKLKKNFFRVMGSNPKEDLDEIKFDINYSKKNLMYYKLKDVSSLVNKDDAITEISYKVDLSKKKSLESLSKDKFTSYLYIPN